MDQCRAFFFYFLVLLLFICHSRILSLPLKNQGKSLSTTEVLAYMMQYGYLEDRSSSQVSSPLVTATPINAVDTGAPITSFNTLQHQNKVSKSKPDDPKKASKTLPKSTGGTSTGGLVRSVHFTDREIETALYDFQRYMDIGLTGRLDEATSASIRQPRCGMKDKLPHLPWTPLRTDHSRRRRYVVQGSKWYGDTVTYTIAKPTTRLSLQQQNDTLYKAIKVWSEIIPITFQWTDEIKKARMVIKFEKGDHGDKQKFDGKGFILAHAFYPAEQPFGGDIHFDDDEDWDIGDLKGVSIGKKSLLLVALHEIGHVLGLQHSNVKSALMYPLYVPKSLAVGKKYTRRAVLDPDDIAGAQSLYGKCGPKLDSIFSWMGDGKTYALKGSQFWKIDDVAKETYPGYPKPISSMWKGIPDNIDEAFLWGHNWKTYFFKGKYYYRYHDSLGKVDDYYPKLISDGWPGIPDNIDAAFTWSNYISYFFKDNLCYRFDNTNNRVYQGYPKNISDVWPGIPNRIDTVFRYYWDGSAYFFSGYEYWKLDDKTSILKGPLKTSNGWKNICLV